MRLDVTACDDGKSVVVAAGLALDKCGREIVVPRRSKPVVIDPAPPKDYEKKDGYKDKKDDEDCDDDWVHLVICYHECRTRSGAGADERLRRQRAKLAWRRARDLRAAARSGQS